MFCKERMTVYETLNSIYKKNDRFHNSYLITDEIICSCNLSDLKALKLIKNVLALYPKFVNGQIKFKNSIRLEDGNSFSIDDLSDEDYTLLKQLDLEQLPISVSVHIADILWLHNHDYLLAKYIEKKYLELFQVFSNNKESCLYSLHYIERTIFIAKSIHDSEYLDTVLLELIEKIKRLSDVENTDFVLYGCRILLNNGYEIPTTINKLDEIIQLCRSNPAYIENAYNLKIMCYQKLNKQKDIKYSHIQLGEYFDACADSMINENCHPLQVSSFYEKAIKEFKKAGKLDKAEEIKRKLFECKKNVSKYMQTYSEEIDLSGVCNIINSDFENLTFQESVIMLTRFVHFYTKQETENYLIDFYKQSDPFFSLLPIKILNREGQTSVTLEPLNYSNLHENENLLDQHLFYTQMLLEEKYSSPTLKLILQLIQKRYKFQEHDLEFITNDNVILPDDRKDIFKIGLYHFLNGDYYEALQILVPQTENLFRYLAEVSGDITATLEDDGTSKRKTLGKVLKLPNFVRCFDSDIMFLFRGLLNEKTGANIRNEIAHGLTSSEDAQSGAYIYFACALLRLLVLNSKDCVTVIDKNKKIQKYFNLKKVF